MKCENCGNEHDGTYATGRFCSQHCSKSFSSKNIEIKTKICKCIKCGDNVIIGYRANPIFAMCILCKNELSKIKNKSNNIKFDIIKRKNKKFNVTKIYFTEISLHNDILNICEMCGKPFIRNTYKKFCSPSCLGKYGGKSKKINTSKMGGLRPGGGKSMQYEYDSIIAGKMKLNIEEIRVAKCLDILNVNWKRNWNYFKYIDIDNKLKKYYPDFYVYDYNYYIEYKGWLTDSMKNKMNMAQKYNNFNLLIIYGNDRRYKNLGLNLEQIESDPKLILASMV